ncbi:hypothetical protein GWK41_07945 [Persephonella atlantica]|uniref:Uncharacterized protein n=1 Tax=Persephonella atlantica TaxID=2699429 RepID=A0ABS1GJA0_9AQUI|nr:hypothetical protein [Persephonella atlantica]MBK3332998.1 hypothetical protein [Persephonella atlantica]
MKKTAFTMLLLLLIGTSYGEEKIKLSSIKDKQMIKCLSDYIKNNKTHITMMINEKGERELLIPESYVHYCEEKLK